MTIALLVTIGLMLLLGGISAGLWGRSHRLRPIVGGIGLILIPLGLWLFGITDLAVNGVKSIIAWAQRTPWSDQLAWGAGLVGAGLLLFIASRWMPSEPKPVKPAAPKPAAQAPAPSPRPQVGTPATPAGSTPATRPAPPAAAPSPSPSPSPAPAKGGVDPEDAEIEALLRKRGIM
ncbi:MAG TPA: hypothetical protein PKE40_01730 [Arachnia sp.]|nr:hypothetical protein [Arachnia sp.]HMT85049.1 hypothetical protein [Arachnia sp.]